MYETKKENKNRKLRQSEVQHKQKGSHEARYELDIKGALVVVYVYDGCSRHCRERDLKSTMR